jgi:hypothetical protein
VFQSFLTQGFDWIQQCGLRSRIVLKQNTDKPEKQNAMTIALRSNLGCNSQHAAKDGERHRPDQKLVRMIFVFAPTDVRGPISFVRSVTETSMIFMIPIPRTISQTGDRLPFQRIRPSKR